MKLNKDGTLELKDFNFDHIQGRMDNAKMSLQEAFEQELETFEINIKDVYSVQTNLCSNKKYCELYCRIACEIDTGRKKWGYSLNGEDYDGLYDTKEDAIKQGFIDAQEYGKEVFFVAKAVITFQPHVYAEGIIEEIQENAYDEGGEYAETYLDDVKREHLEELEEKLNEVLSNWINKYEYNPNFYSVEDIEEVQVQSVK